jgi:type II secretory pathway pseudopilin PulG
MSASSFPIRPSSFVLRPYSRRAGVTIIEVLFAIMITSVGLLGAIALFPVASTQARRARLNDMVGNAGRTAFHDFDTRGMRRPDRWLAWDQIKGQFITVNPGGNSPSNLQSAESFCIDPRMIAAHTSTSTTGPTSGRQFLTTTSATGNPGGQCVQTFPYLEPFVDQNNNSFWQTGEAFTDLNNNSIHDPPQLASTYFAGGVYPSFDSTLMRRITLWDGIPGTGMVNPATGAVIPGTARAGNIPWALTLTEANAIFEIDDDISYFRPDGSPDANGRPTDKSDPARQNATLLSTGYANSWGRRQAEGKITWIATIVPEFDVSGVAEDQYTLSIVMIYDRPNRLDDLISNPNLERVVNGVWQGGTGATGGEIYLTSTSYDQLKIRPNDWIMVSGSYDYLHTGTGPYVTRFQWYRVAECDPEPSALAGGGYELYATLMGQDWNMNFTNPPGSSTANVRVTIVEGAFAVYEKSIRLEYGSTF